MDNLNKWENFRIDGIIEMNYQDYSLRKNVAFRKLGDIVRIDIFDTGLMGLHPTPYISIYLDSLLTMRLPEENDPVILQRIQLEKDHPLLKAFFSIPELSDDAAGILKSRETRRYNCIIEFSQALEIDKITDDDYSLLLYYNPSLSEIKLFSGNELILKILVDSIIFAPVAINKLSRR